MVKFLLDASDNKRHRILKNLPKIFIINSKFIQPKLNLKGDLSLATTCCVLLLDSVFYMTLAWYIESIAPGEFGVARNWYFMFTFNFWLGNKSQEEIKSKEIKPISRTNDQITESSGREILRMKMMSDKDIEKKTPKISELIETPSNDENSAAGIECVDLHKIYVRGRKHALRGLSVKFFKNEISALLGHNGAGK